MNLIFKTYNSDKVSDDLSEIIPGARIPRAVRAWTRKMPIEPGESFEVYRDDPDGEGMAFLLIYQSDGGMPKRNPLLTGVAVEEYNHDSGRVAHRKTIYHVSTSQVQDKTYILISVNL